MLKKIFFFMIIIFFIVCIQNVLCCNDINQVKDQVGRIVELNNKICRVVSLAPSITEIIISIGAQEKLVGVVQHDKYPIYNKYPIVGSYMNPNLEKIIALNPDICFAIRENNSKNIVNYLNFFNIPVYILDLNKLYSVLHAINEIGFLLDCEVDASINSTMLDNRVQYVKEILLNYRKYPSVFVQLSIFPIISVGSGTIIDDLIYLSNGRNILRTEKKYPSINREDVLRLTPDIIIISSMGKGENTNLEKLEWEKWFRSFTTANKEIFVENFGLFLKPSQDLILGLEKLAKIIHPELLEE